VRPSCKGCVQSGRCVTAVSYAQFPLHLCNVIGKSCNDSAFMCGVAVGIATSCLVTTSDVTATDIADSGAGGPRALSMTQLFPS
jgi:hypothetical protein